MSILKPIVIAMATSIVSLAAAGGALAAGIKSEVEITSATGSGDGVVIKGKVSSKRVCTKAREVSVYHDVNPPRPTPNDFFLGTAETSGKGKWTLAAIGLFPDKVYAIVKKQARNGPDCKGDTSPTVDVE